MKRFLSVEESQGNPVFRGKVWEVVEELDKIPTVEGFAYHWKYASDLDAKDIMKRFNIKNLPALIVFDSNGKVYYRHEGKGFSVGTATKKLIEILTIKEGV